MVGGANACTSVPRTSITRDPENPGESGSQDSGKNPTTTRTPPPVCGNRICEPPKESNATCPRDCP
jgi:hypothetical protein